MNYNLKLSELLQNVKTWSELKAKLEEFNTSQTETTTKKTTAGKLFEYFTKYYFTVNPEYSQLYSKVWLYDEIPTEIKLRLNFPDRDFGIDLLLQDNQNRFTAVQCKFKNDEDYILKWKRDSLTHPFTLAERCNYVMIFTNAAGCVSEIEQREKYVQVAIGELINTSAEVLSAIKLFIDTNTIKSVEKYSRLPHQVIAVNKTVEYFNSNDRTQLILPCGAGKTLAALWVKEDLQSKNTLVLFPSLALLRQFKTEWANQRSEDYIYINVCSERDIDVAAEDSTVTHTYEISGEVTTSPDRIREFLSSATNKIVFSTYQSIEAVETALKFLPNFSFDLIICDEAHRTAGQKTNTFAIVHDQSRIRGKKRLYMTATPKVASSKLKAKMGDEYELLCDMSKTEIFGDEAHSMSFGEAIQQNILVDYKIIGIGVTHKQVKEFIDKRRYVTEKYDMKEIADNFALDIAMEKYSAFHAITFHSRVQTADDFAKRHNNFFSPDVYARHVSGEHTTSRRAKVLTEFKLHQKGIVSNARCLTEGVDVPIIDLIYFCDPKNSTIDIVQASGRALRKDRHGKKPIGYIVVPIYHHIDEDIEKEIEKKPYFQNLIQVIRSLCDQDERLRAEIDDVAYEKGEKKSKRIEITYNDSEIEKIIKLDGLDKKVREYLFDQIIQKTKNNWNVRFKELTAFKEKHGTTDVSRKHDEEILRWWTQEQRNAYHQRNTVKLNHERIKKLESIGFDWKGQQRLTYLPPDEKWRRNYEKLKEYFEEHGNTDIPARYVKDKPLATWVVSQRVKYDEGRLSDEQILLLEELKIDWDPRNIFEEKIKAFLAYQEKYGNLLIPQGNKEFKKEGRWVNRFRSIYNGGNANDRGDIVKSGLGRIKKEHLDRLNEIGFVWFAGNPEWNERFEEVKQFYLANGHSSISQSENQTLFYWSYRNRRNKEKLEPEQIEKLKSIEFVFDVSADKEDNFLDNLIELQKFHDANNHFVIGNDNEEFKGLRIWLLSIRKQYRDGELETEKIEMLKSIGFNESDFTPVDKKWNVRFEELKMFFEKNNTFAVPNLKEYRSLRLWLKYQLKANSENTLDQDKKEKLESIGFSFGKSYLQRRTRETGGVSSIWDNRIEQMQKYFQKHNTFFIPISDTANTSLRLWLQRAKKEYKQGTLSEPKFKSLIEIGFDFINQKKSNTVGIQKRSETLWLERIRELRNYFEERKTFYIESTDKENQSLLLWLRRVRKDYEQNTLRNDRIADLKNIGFDFNTEYRSQRKEELDPRWSAMFDEFKIYYKENNTFYIPPENEKLTNWIRTQRTVYNQGELEAEKVELIQSLGYSFSTKYYHREGISKIKKGFQDSWQRNFDWLKSYYENNQTFLIAQNDNEHKSLRAWLQTQRMQYRNKTLLKEREEKLLALGYDFEKKFTGSHLLNRPKRERKVKPSKSTKTVSSWDEFFLRLVNFKLTNGSCLIRKSDPDKSLYEWVVKQRTHRRKNLLSPEQVSKLDLLGFEWGESKLLSEIEVWMKGYEKLKAFHAVHNHTMPAKADGDMQLVSWVTQQRHRHRKGNLKPEYVNLLNQLNFEWEPEKVRGKGSKPDDEKWLERFQELIDFKQKFGTTNVSQTSKEYYSLARWVLDQRIENRKAAMSDFRKQKLEEVGFIWDARKHNANAQL